MKIVLAVFMGWAMLQIGQASMLYDRLNETDPIEEQEEEKFESAEIDDTPRTRQVQKILEDALKKTDREVRALYVYGCWCGKRGHGKYVDNFDFCCKVHDFCDEDILNSADKCRVEGRLKYYQSKLKYNKDTYKCTPISEYRARKMEERRCRHAVCLCDMEMIRCMIHYKDEINVNNILYQHCPTGDDVCKPMADVIVLIQDSQGISTTTVQNIKTVVRRLLTILRNEKQDYNFALATYSSSRRMSCFGSASETITHIDTKYHHTRTGRNLLSLALSKMISKQFDKRPEDRKGDGTEKILIVFSDGNAENENGDDTDPLWLQKTAKSLRTSKNIKMIGALIPNTQNTQQIDELKSIVSEPDDAIEVEFSAANLNDIANRLSTRVRRLVCRGGDFCRTKVDVIVLIQDSQGIPITTVQSIKPVVRRLMTVLDSETQDYNFALTTYSTSRQTSSFGSAADTISYMDTKYHYGGSGRHLLNLALRKMILKQFDRRPDDRKGDDTAEILVIFSDGNAEDENGEVMDTVVLEKTAQLLRVDNNIKIVGALTPNTDNTQRIEGLKSIVSEPDDAINVEFSDANLNDIADRLGARVKQMVCRGGEFCKTKADVIFLIQDSEGISLTTIQSIKFIVRRLLNLLRSERQDYNFALARYATSRRMSCFGSAEETISYVDTEYYPGGRGHNLLNLAMSEMVLKQFDERRDDRKGDETAKVLVILSDGNAEHENGDVMDTFWLEKTAKLVRVNNNIKIVGALIPNAKNTQRIQELKSIVSKPDDAINIEFSASNLNDIADRLADRIRELVVCRVKYTVKVYTPETHVKNEYRLTVRIEGDGEQKTADHVLLDTTQEREGSLQVIKFEFFERDVGHVKKIEIKTQRIKEGRRGWTLQEVKVIKGKETVTAVFREEISYGWQSKWYSARAWRRPYVKYTVEVYTPDKSAKKVISLTVRISGKEKETKNQVLQTTTEEQGDLLVFKAHFTDLNMARMTGIWIRPATSRKWTLNKVKFKKGKQTVIADFNLKIRAWGERWYYASARKASDSPTDA